jgi:hypothetical protein
MPQGSILWQGPAGFSSTISNPYILNVSTAHSGAFTVTVTDSGCSSSDTQFVTVNQRPATPVAQLVDSPVCAGRQLKLIANSGTVGVTYNWSGPLNSTSQNPVFNNVLVAHSGTYVVEAILANCSSSDTVQITINPSPPPPAVEYKGGCTGDTLKLLASGSFGTYTWYDSLGLFNAVTATGVATRPNAQTGYEGKYFVFVSSAAGCESDTVSLDVSIGNKPEIPVITNPNPALCVGRKMTLSANSTTPGVTYSWTGPGGLTATGSSITYGSVNEGMTGVYTARAALGACTSSTATTVDIQPNITPAVSISANPDVEVMPMTKLEFKARVFNGGEQPKYQWRLNNADIPGATDSVYTAVAGVEVKDGERVSVFIRSSATCPLPDSILSYVFTVDLKTAVADVNVANETKIYPNPNNGSFRIKGTVNTANPVEVKVTDISGKEVYRSTITPVAKTLDHPIYMGRVTSGIYLLQLKIDEQFITTRFSVTE